MEMPNNFTEKEIAQALAEYFLCRFEVKEITKKIKENKNGISQSYKSVDDGEMKKALEIAFWVALFGIIAYMAGMIAQLPGDLIW